MNSLKVHLGYVETEKPIDEIRLKSFEYDITQCPSLFINRDNSTNTPENDYISLNLMDKIKETDKKDKYLKTVIIDNGLVSYCSAVPEYQYKKKDPEAMMKRIRGIVNKIYDSYLHNNDFFPYTKYVIMVKNTPGLENYLIDIMSKLGPIGVYLIFSGNKNLVEEYPHIKSYLFGQIRYFDLPGWDNRVDMCAPYYASLFERFKPECENIATIYSDFFYKRRRDYLANSFNDIFG